LADDPSYATRMLRTEHGDSLNELFFLWASGLQSHEIVDRLRKARVPVALIVDEIKELIDDQHARESGLIRQVDGSWQVGAGFEIDNEWPDEHPAHALGQDTRDALQRFGLSAEEIERLSAAGVIKQA
jgi:crotonobetainyl-CoA:carnitine CoA-transferase CaiB-like acyl-CoA transferase